MDFNRRETFWLAIVGSVATLFTRAVQAIPSRGQPSTEYVDPDVVGGTGSGTSWANARKYVSQIGAAANTRILFKPGLIRPKAPVSGAMGLSLTTFNHPRATFAADNLQFQVDGPGDIDFCGAVEWAGSTGTQTLNSLACRTVDTGSAVLPYWFPRVFVDGDWRATYPALCTATDDDAVDSFATNPADFDNNDPGVPGCRFIPNANWGGTTDNTKEVSYVDRGSGHVPLSERYLIRIRAPGFLSRANAVQDLIGCPVLHRNAANFTSYFGKVLTYNNVNGYIEVGSPGVAAHSASDPFFWALFAHPYGVRVPYHYAATKSGGVYTGWVAAIPAGAIDIACYSSIFYCTGDSIRFFAGRDVRGSAICHGQDTTIPRGGALFMGEQSNANCIVGNAIVRQIRDFGRGGSPIQFSGPGIADAFRCGGIHVTDSLAGRTLQIAPGSHGGANSIVTGPIFSSSTGGGVRVAGGVNGLTVRDAVIAPRRSVHDNGCNIYQAAIDITLDGIVVCGSISPYAEQWSVVTGSPTYGSISSTGRNVQNSYFSGRPNSDLSGYSSVFTMRTDNGAKGSNRDRVIAVGQGNLLRGKAYSLAGMKHSRGLFDRLVVDGIAADAVVFDRMTFCGRARGLPESSTIAHLRSIGCTVTDCYETPAAWESVFDAEMWQRLTSKRDRSGYEAWPFLAPQLGLMMPAYRSDKTRTIVRPALVSTEVNTGMSRGFVFAELLNPIPLTACTLAPGQGDNAMLGLHLGRYIYVKGRIPVRPVLTIALDVKSTANPNAVTNGPGQRYFYQLPVRQFI